MAPRQPDRPYPQKVVWRHNDLHCDIIFLMAPDTPQRLSGNTIQATHHNQLAPQYLLSQIIIAQESSKAVINIFRCATNTMYLYVPTERNMAAHLLKHWFVTRIGVGVGTKKTSPLQCSPVTSRSRGGGNGYRTAKHNQLYLKGLNWLTVAGDPEQQRPW
jgi:hypothetical protein